MPSRYRVYHRPTASEIEVHMREKARTFAWNFKIFPATQWEGTRTLEPRLNETRFFVGRDGSTQTTEKDSSATEARMSEIPKVKKNGRFYTDMHALDSGGVA
jgi:hypothetical protein